MSEPMLDVRGLHKAYRTGERTIQVLQGLDLQVGLGETVAVVGESGVGKSTLLHLLGGLDRPDAGELRFEEIEVGQLVDARLQAYRNRSVGFVFQFHYLLPEFTALENVQMPLRIARTAGDIAGRSAEALRLLGLAERLHHHPGALSGGEQQRVAIARAVVMQPRLVLADEPTGNLDPATGGRVFERLTALQGERGFAMVLATHNEKLARSCNRVLRLSDGLLRPLGDAETREYFEGTAHETGHR
jgi:lipoprotein-releasing system ATP-binding protein